MGGGRHPSAFRSLWMYGFFWKDRFSSSKSQPCTFCERFHCNLKRNRTKQNKTKPHPNESELGIIFSQPSLKVFRLLESIPKKKTFHFTFDMYSIWLKWNASQSWLEARAICMWLTQLYENQLTVWLYQALGHTDRGKAIWEKGGDTVSDDIIKLW